MAIKLKFKTSITKKMFFNMPEIKRDSGQKYWTERELITLIDSYNKGDTPFQMAKTVGPKRSVQACMAKIAQLRREQEVIKESLK